MTEPEKHSAEPAEGAEEPGSGNGGRTPHSEDPAEGADTGGDDDDPDA